MKLSASYKKRNLKFEFVARTSRGSLREKDSYYIILRGETGTIGIGEASPLKALSVDDVPDFEEKVDYFTKLLDGRNWDEVSNNIEKVVGELVPAEFPSIRFAVETALLDLKNGGSRIIFPGGFSEGSKGIEINGLIWMGDLEFMLTQITQKIWEGFTCVKIKIGSLDFERECDILKYIRSKYYKDKIEIRVDANGAFKPENALARLDTLYEYDLHSIEQPIKQGQWEMMRTLCKQTPVPIVLDEELIGISTPEKMKEMLEFIHPQFIVLKPTLLGGFYKTQQWITLAEDLGIGWWITSALESSIGLNAICQFTDSLLVKVPQGLGTGMIYSNNIPSPLHLKNSEIRLGKSLSWDLQELINGNPK